MEPLRRVFRGYEPAQVDRLISDFNSRLEAIAREVELLRNQNDKLIAENASLKSANQDLAGRETAVNDALVSAHLRAQEILAESRREAEVLLQVAREAGQRLQEDLKGRIADLNWQIESLSLQRQSFQNDFRAVLEGYMSQLSEPSQSKPAISMAQSQVLEGDENSEGPGQGDSSVELAESAKS